MSQRVIIVHRTVRIKKKKNSRKKPRFIVKRKTIKSVRTSPGKVVKRYYSARTIKRLAV